MEDCPERLFKCWIVKNLNVPASGGGVEIPQRTAFDKVEYSLSLGLFALPIFYPN